MGGYKKGYSNILKEKIVQSVYVGSSWEFDATFWDFIHGLDQCLGVCGLDQWIPSRVAEMRIRLFNS